MFEENKIPLPPGVKIILPTAPVRQITLEDDTKNYYAWFDILGDKNAEKPEPREYKDKKEFDQIMEESFD